MPANKIVLLIIALAWQLPAAAEELYRWVDADGKVHFGDRPPQDAQAESIEAKLKPINRADATRREDFPDTRRAQQIEQQYRDKQRQQDQKQARRQQQVCNRARRELEILRGPVYFVDANGKESTISEREREARARTLQAEIRQYCGG